MSDEVLLSVVVPVYDVDPWLSECLDSIQRQSFTQWECILVDDGSKDFSGVICDSYSRRDSRFKVIHQKNGGVSAARNTGIEAATAPLLSFVDPDDFLSKNYFDELVAELTRINADISVSNFCTVEECGNEGMYWLTNRLEKYLKTYYNPSEMLNNQDVIKAVCNNFFSCVSWGKIFKRELWGDTRFPIGVDLGEDMMTVPTVIIKAGAAIYAQNATYYYRCRRKSLLHGTVSRERYEKDLQASGEMLNRLVKYDPEHKQDFKLLKLMYDIGCYASFVKSNPEEQTGKSKLYTMYKAVGGSEGFSILKHAITRISKDGSGND